MEMNWKVKDSGLRAVVTDIRWERIKLTLEVEVSQDTKDKYNISDLVFYGVNILGEAQMLFDTEVVSEDKLYLKINVTSDGRCQCVPNGSYRICVCHSTDVLAECETADFIVGRLADLSRNFLYHVRNKTYNVTFYVEEEDRILPFRINILNAGKAGLDFPRNPSFIKRFTPIRALKDCFFSVRTIIRNMYWFYSKLYRGKKDKTILFMTEQSDVIKSNLKAVSDRMIARGMDSEYTLLYSARKPTESGQSKKSWFQLVKMLARSGTIFIDDHAPLLDWLKLDDDTRLIQLWHAGAGFKSSGYSRWGNQGCPAPQSCHRQYTYGIAGSKNIAPFFSEVWGINDEQVLPTGMPRMDEYLDENHKQEKIKELYEQFPMCKDKKVILFAPTYRGKNQIAAYYPYELINFEKLYEVCGEEYVVLFKMHPWVNNDIKIKKQYKDKFLDVKNYPNINDLFYIVDLLITDYSSNIFEYSLMNKPMLFFAFDKIQYSFSRGFHRAYEASAPGKVCYTFDELLEAIEKKDFEFEKVAEYVTHHFDYIDSGASDRVIDWIVLEQLPEDMKSAIQKKKDAMKQMEELHFMLPEEVEGLNG